MKVGTDGVLLGSWACSNADYEPLRVLDVGTGTGLIALFLAQRFPNAQVIAIDIDPDAVRVPAKGKRKAPFGICKRACKNPAFEIDVPVGILQ